MLLAAFGVLPVRLATGEAHHDSLVVLVIISLKNVLELDVGNREFLRNQAVLLTQLVEHAGFDREPRDDAVPLELLPSVLHWDDAKIIVNAHRIRASALRNRVIAP